MSFFDTATRVDQHPQTQGARLSRRRSCRLWEMLDGQREIGVTVHEVEEKLDAGAVINAQTIPIEPFDNLTSLALKAHVVANDLLV